MIKFIRARRWQQVNNELRIPVDNSTTIFYAILLLHAKTGTPFRWCWFVGSLLFYVLTAVERENNGPKRAHLWIDTHSVCICVLRGLPVYGHAEHRAYWIMKRVSKFSWTLWRTIILVHFYVRTHQHGHCIRIRAISAGDKWWYCLRFCGFTVYFRFFLSFPLPSPSLVDIVDCMKIGPRHRGITNTNSFSMPLLKLEGKYGWRAIYERHNDFVPFAQRA